MKEQIQKAFKDTVKLCGDEEKMKNITTNQSCYAYFIHGYQAALTANAKQIIQDDIAKGMFEHWSRNAISGNGKESAVPAQEPSEAAISAAMSEGNKLGIKSTDAARIVAAYLLAQQPAQEPAVTEQMIEAAEGVEDLYKRGTPQTWAKVFRAMWREMPTQEPVNCRHSKPQCDMCAKTLYEQCRYATQQPAQEPVSKTPNNDHVICPACVHEFRAIPMNVQQLMIDAGFKPPFTEPVKQESKWMPIETAPKGKKIIVSYKNACGKDRTVFAKYIEKFTEESTCDTECETDYSEDDDTFYLKEGWVELIDNWDEFSSVYFDSANIPTHWMPLPLPPVEVKE